MVKAHPGGSKLEERNWNCWGANSKIFHSLVRDLRQEYEVNFINLLETQISGQRGQNIRNRIGLDSSFVVKATGHFGGIWCLWNSGTLKVDALENNRQMTLTAIYGSPQRLNRRSLWNTLRRLENYNTLPWCLLRDFNPILHDHEHRGGSIRNNPGACLEF
ncbi:hypothetical protein Ahy_A09g045175 [Arachis hypogaea]|uniref:Endonuclease/exonuclease/phosphatase domain-containing protein n=1 Tax=Arachis hypogaea TaxID=3818 RepID=A0A445BLR6_ARAHY|nr:hypothetical protein Ahy_A09g045175 [Arachis hypogaea]